MPRRHVEAIMKLIQINRDTYVNPDHVVMVEFFDGMTTIWTINGEVESDYNLEDTISKLNFRSIYRYEEEKANGTQ